MMLHKVTHDLLVLGREAVRQPWFLPGGIEQRVPGLARPYLLTQRPERCLVRQDTAPPPADVQDGRFVRTNNGHHVTGGAITLHLANPVRVWCHVKGGDIWPLHVPSMDEIPIGQLVVAPNFELSRPFYYLDHVAMLVLLQRLNPLKPQLPLGTLLPCPPPGSGDLMHGVHQGCLVDIRIAISPTGGESIGWVPVDVIVHVGKGFRKGLGLVFGLRRALACALWWGLTFALRRALACALWGGLTFASWGAMAFALWMGLAFACALLGAFALRRAMPFALLCAFALCRAMPFALLRAMAFALLRAFALGKAIPFAMLWAFALLWAFAFAVLRAFALPMAMGLCLPSVWHVVWVGDREQTPAAQRPAVGELGVERRPWSGRCGRGPRVNSCGSAARSGWVRRGTTTLVGALWPGTEGELLQLRGPQ